MKSTAEIHSGRSTPARQRGFTLLELVIAIVVILLLATGSYIRYMALAADAERAAFKGVSGWLRAGLNMEVSGALGRNDMASLEALEMSNPMSLVMKVMEPPSNYLGELSGTEARNAAAGHWYYDLDQRLLAYHVRYNRNLEAIAGTNYNRLYFKLKVSFRPADRNGMLRPGGLRLEPVEQGFPKDAPR